MKLLTIETTCDETAAAVVTDRLEVLSSVVASQDHLHERFGGVVPEIASRAHVERILPVIDEALAQSGPDAARFGCGRGGEHAGAGRLVARGADGGEGDRAGVRIAAGGRSIICRRISTPAEWRAAAMFFPVSVWS